MANKNIKLGIFWFRKDLRIHDNYALLELNKKVDIILPIFIIDPNKMEKKNNNILQFMFKSLRDLNDQLHEKLIYFYNDPVKVFNILINELKKDYNNIYIGFNADFTDYSKKCENEIIKLMESLKIKTIINYDDHYIIPFNKLIKNNITDGKGKSYLNFNDFYNNAIKTNVKKPIKLLDYKFGTLDVKGTSDEKGKIKLDKNIIYDVNKIKSLYKYNNDLAFSGGRNNCIIKLSNKNRFKNYKNNILLINNYTTEISAYINFGCMSIREIYYYTKTYNDFSKQLYYHNYHLCIYRFNTNHLKLKIYTNLESNYNLLIQANTGVLLIDAAINELKKVGYINNKLRILVCVYSIKYLFLDPYSTYGIFNIFKKYLLDYSSILCKRNIDELIKKYKSIEINNNLNKQLDPEYIYIKKWLKKK